MVGKKDAAVDKVMRSLRKALRERIPSRYGVRLRALPTGHKDLWDILVISDYFRGKGFHKRLKFLQKVADGVLTPEEQFRFCVLPFTEREARERGL